MIKQTRLIVTAAFGLSGFAALTYQISWIRELGSFFGIQVYSAATVLTAFMAGLALGSYLFGKIADRIRRPLLMFAFMELILAVYALSFPSISEWIARLFYAIAPDAEGIVVYSQFVRFMVAFPVLLVATSIMGGTLPVLTRSITGKSEQLGVNVGNLYGSNNLGALLGGFFTGYIFLHSIGISGALVVGAIMNGANAIIVMLIQRNQSPMVMPSMDNEKQAIETESRAFPIRVKRVVLWVFALEGFTTLGYEIIWTRILHEFSYDKTSFFYTTIIITFVAGLSAGSFMASRVMRKWKDPLKKLAQLQISIGFSSVIMFLVFAAIAPSFHQFQSSQETWWGTVVTEQLFIFIHLLFPALLMGFTFPLVSVIYNKSSGQIGRDIGSLGALDTIGSVFGTVLTGFLFIPILGTLRSLLMLVGLNLLLGTWLLKYSSKSLAWIRVMSVIIAGVILLTVVLPDHLLPLNRRWNTVLKDEVYFYNEGPAASVAVTKYRERNAALSINGAITAYTLTNDVRVHKMLGILPWLFNDEPENALVVGLGIGITAKTLDMAEVKNISVAELSPGVIQASKEIFGTTYRNNKSLKIYPEDGRAHLFRNKESYDLITTNAVHPRLGNGIYTRDFYQLCFDRLSEQGTMCQWIPTNWMTRDEYKILLRSFAEVFPWSTLWVMNDAHTILLGRKKVSQNFTLAEIGNKFDASGARTYLMESGLVNEADILSHFWMNNQALKKYVDESSLNTDNRPVIEFSRVVSRAPDSGVLHDLTVNFQSIETLLDEPEYSGQLFERIELKQYELRERLRFYIKQLE